MGLKFLWFYVQEHPKAQTAVVLVLKRFRRRGNDLNSHRTDWEKPGIEPATPGLQQFGPGLCFYLEFGVPIWSSEKGPGLTLVRQVRSKERANPGSAGSGFGERTGPALVWSSGSEKGPGPTLVQQVRSSEKGPGPTLVQQVRRKDKA